MPQFETVTLFKIRDEADRDKVLELVKELKIAVKDGKPYILSMQAGHIRPSPKSQGWTLAIKGVFKSQEDLEYYNFECPAHKKLKATADAVKEEDVLSISFANVVG